MTSRPYASTRTKMKKRAGGRNGAARTTQPLENASAPAMELAVPPTAKLLACISQAKHQRLAEMLRDLRIGAEALSANADGLLSRLS